MAAFACGEARHDSPRRGEWDEVFGLNTPSVAAFACGEIRHDSPRRGEWGADGAAIG